ncbi:MAG: myo-inositol-1-phosphate synthase [Gammaproteobacteria bacterium]|nr:myo-inositol-1-phosphate synthase [Gammaproteobacteria bacterium]
MENRGYEENGRVGLWIAGAKGDIAATLMVGKQAIALGLTSSAGITSDLPPMNRLPLIPLKDLVVGGIDISTQPLAASAESLYRKSRTISREVLDGALPALACIEEDILVEPRLIWKPSDPQPADTTPLRQLTDRLQAHIRGFRKKHRLSHVVAVNLTSAEPEPDQAPEHETLEGLEQLITEDRKDLITPGVCYLYAALREDCSFLNFTPNPGTTFGGIAELADQQNLPYYGNDGKTGETLVKTALAPLFAYRNLRVLSWEGVNLLGNNDGLALDDPDNRTAKLRNKGQVLNNILGYEPHAGVDINYVPSLGDWKTAWDLIHFQGFLDVKMTMQFTWQGCDSILAAPLVLDMARLAEFAARHGESGPMHHLAAFFKHPIEVPEMAFHTQFERLLRYTETHLAQQSETLQDQEVSVQ